MEPELVITIHDNLSILSMIAMVTILITKYVLSLRGRKERRNGADRRKYERV